MRVPKPSYRIAQDEKGEGWYRLAYRSISGLVKFRPGKPISKHYRALIRWHYDQLRIISASGTRPVHIYRTKDAKRLKRAQDAAGMITPNMFRVAIFTKGEGKARVVFTANSVKLISQVGKSDTVIRDFFPFEDYENEPGELATDPEEVIARTTEAAGEQEIFIIQCGTHEGKVEYSSADHARQVINEYFETYENVLEWCKGVVGYRFTNQASYSEYQAKRKGLNKTKQRRIRARKKKT